MIYGIGVDIAAVSRFEKWVRNPAILERFFNAGELSRASSIRHCMEHYAARFAAKEAFGKALGTGITGFSLKDVHVAHYEDGRPCLCVENSARSILDSRCGRCAVHLSLSHEREYAVAYVIIECFD